MNEKRKDEKPRAETAQAPPARKQEPPPKKQAEDFDEQALDEVLRDCPL